MQILIYAQPTDSNKKFYDQSQHSINQYGAKDRLCIWGAGIKLLSNAEFFYEQIRL